MPELPSFQNFRRKVRRNREAGVILSDTHDLRQWAKERELPAKLDDVEPYVVYSVPYDTSKFPDVEAVAFTMHVQISWIGILVRVSYYYVCHIDGKYKLHHGDWMLITFGTHSIHLDDKGVLRHTFNPLVYLFMKQQESKAAVCVGLCCVDLIARRYFDKPFAPYAAVADHGHGIREGWRMYCRLSGMGMRTILGCFPHIMWHLTHGALLPKSHPKFDEVVEVVGKLHHCPTKGTWNVLLKALARRWGDRDLALNDLWDSIFVAPYDNWYLGHDSSAPLTYPSNQVEESWHNNGIMRVLAREMQASTETLLTVNLPKIMKLDAAKKADKLVHSIPLEWVPKSVYLKAQMNLADSFKYVRVVDIPGSEKEDGTKLRAYYVLSRSQEADSYVYHTCIISVSLMYH